MKNNKLTKKRILFIGIVVLIAIPILALIIFGFNQSRARKDTKELISNIEFECPNGAVDNTDQWGMSGYVRYCADGETLNGMWTAWENRVVAIKGIYKDGKKEGEWIWYNKNGGKYKTVIFESGRQISETIHTEYKW